MSMSTSTKTSVDDTEREGRLGSQTLLRGLDVLEAVMGGAVTVADLTKRLGLARSTAHRLASSLVDRRYLSYTAQDGYRLGPKLLELGYHARHQVVITRVVRPYLESLSRQTGHTVHLGIVQGAKALYLDKIAGRRPIEISSHVGDMHALTTTGLGKALILDDDEGSWRRAWKIEHPNASEKGFRIWAERMHHYANERCSFDLEENEEGIRCVGSPIRDSTGRVIAAISVSGASRYMNDAHMRKLAKDLLVVVEEISKSLGWVPLGRAHTSD